MLDALCFGLFNKPFRKITRGQLVNSINEKSTKVEVTFSIGKDEYRVFRGIKPNIFELYRNNKLVDQDAAANDTQKYLEDQFSNSTSNHLRKSSSWVHPLLSPSCNSEQVTGEKLSRIYWTSRSSQK